VSRQSRAARCIVSTCLSRNETTHHAINFGVIATCGSDGLERKLTSSPGIFSIQVNAEPSLGLTPSCDQPAIQSTRSLCRAIQRSTLPRSFTSHWAQAGSEATRARAPAQSSTAVRQGRPWVSKILTSANCFSGSDFGNTAALRATVDKMAVSRKPSAQRGDLSMAE
jgi:hypothetical protein